MTRSRPLLPVLVCGLVMAALGCSRERPGASSASQRDSAQTQHDVALASLRAAIKNAEANVEQAVAVQAGARGAPAQPEAGMR